MITFKASSVETNKNKTSLVNAETILNKFKTANKMPEAFSFNSSDSFISESRFDNNFVAAINHAYSNHYTLTLSPDDIWITLVQGFSAHVNQNAEKLRNKFVKHEGKEIIRVERDYFIKGSPNNDWQGVFTEFSDKISEYIGKQRDLIISDFSTTTVLEKAVSQVCLMDCMKQYFDYRVRTLCGIPEITLLGETSDWESIKTRFQNFCEYDLQWWVDAAMPILDQFIEASKGNIDTNFWSSIYKKDGGSGGPYISGWISVLFPYLVDYKGNYFINNKLDWQNRRGFGGLTINNFPNSCSSVPFIWEYYGEEIKMQFVAGFIGISQDDNCIIKPVMGWMIREE
jgi:hypothetical protein